MFKLKIITSTTRPGHKGTSIARWMRDLAAQDPQWEIELLDLAAIDLPMMDEPNHPRFANYQQEHTKRWSATINEADAFIFVVAEYNYSFTAPLKNAIDYLLKEWAGKPAGLVSYGGVSAGTRAANALRIVLSAVDVMPLAAGVPIPFYAQRIDEAGVFTPDEATLKRVAPMMTELKRWTPALKAMREGK